MISPLFRLDSRFCKSYYPGQIVLYLFWQEPEVPRLRLIKAVVIFSSFLPYFLNIQIKAIMVEEAITICSDF